MSALIDSYVMMFNYLRGYDVEFFPISELAEDAKDLMIFKVTSKNQEKKFIMIIKSLTPSSRNTENELNFQVIHGQRDRINKLCKSLKAIPIYSAWNQELGVLLVPAFEKVERSANQGSIYLNKDFIIQNKDNLKDSVCIKRINETDVYANNILLGENIGGYLTQLLNDEIDYLTGHPKNHQVLEYEFIKLPKGSQAEVLPSKKIKTNQKDIFTPRNVILYGPPGTGKTRAALILANELFEAENVQINAEKLTLSNYPKDFEEKYGLNFLRVQFHPSFSYEDFFEGLRPVQISMNGKSEIIYMVVPGVFKIACQLAKAYSDPSYGIEINAQYIKGDSNETGRWMIGENSPYASYKLIERSGKLEFKGNVVQLTGTESKEFVVLIENEPQESGLYNVKWFASEDNNLKNFVLFIDELNRGNPAKVFGEALSLIEESKRIGGAEQGEIHLPYSHEKFQVPQNLHIVCSMNTSDRSLTILDQAFRRRFEFIYLPPMFEIVENEKFKQNYKISQFRDEVLVSLKSHFSLINESLGTCGVSAENYLGHSYMLKVIRSSWKDLVKLQEDGEKIEIKQIKEVVSRSLENIWAMEIHSQLREILGEHRLSEFCDNYISLLGKQKNPGIFTNENGDFSKKLKLFLSNPLPESNNFPWKLAS